MYYGEIKDCDIANGAGVRVTIFVSGCRNRCKGCFQPQTWDFNYGEEFTVKTEEYILGLLQPSYIQGITLLGGDPFEPENQRVLLPFLKKLKTRYPGKTVWAFSGYTYDVLTGDPQPEFANDGILHEGYGPVFCHALGPDPRTELTDEMLSYVDVLVDGPFIEEEKDITLRFRGSRNQRLLDLNAMRKNGGIVQLPDRVSSARRNVSTAKHE